MYREHIIELYIQTEAAYGNFRSGPQEEGARKQRLIQPERIPKAIKTEAKRIPKSPKRPSKTYTWQRERKSEENGEPPHCF